MYREHKGRFETAEKVVKKSSSMGKIRGVFVVTGRNVIVATHSLKLILVDTHKHYRFYLTLWRRILHGIYYSSIPEPIYYVVYEFDENGTEMIVYRKQLIHKENAWVIQ